LQKAQHSRHCLSLPINSRLLAGQRITRRQ